MAERWTDRVASLGLICNTDGATFSGCGQYRYGLSRVWDLSKPRVMFLMLNPSTADESNDDPTIRRCIGFAKSWGFGSLVVGNIFAFRATDPKAMKRADDPVGPDNDDAIGYMALRSDMIVAAWGSHGKYRDRGRSLAEKLYAFDMRCLGTTKDGQPRHPLYIKGDTSLIKYPAHNKPDKAGVKDE